MAAEPNEGEGYHEGDPQCTLTTFATQSNSTVCPGTSVLGFAMCAEPSGGEGCHEGDPRCTEAAL